MAEGPPKPDPPEIPGMTASVSPPPDPVLLTITATSQREQEAIEQLWTYIVPTRIHSFVPTQLVIDVTVINPQPKEPENKQ